MSKILNSVEWDKQWKRREDARTLAEAEVIKSDAKRLKGAVTEAKTLVKEKKEELLSIGKIAKKSAKKVLTNKKKK